MKYRAQLVDPGNATAERVQQIHTNSFADVSEWALGNPAGRKSAEDAGGVLAAAKSPDAYVIVYELREAPIATLTKPKPKEAGEDGSKNS